MKKKCKDSFLVDTDGNEIPYKISECPKYWYFEGKVKKRVEKPKDCSKSDVVDAYMEAHAAYEKACGL